jgi:4a-hydroxytetrahydrobiopterin dehydratase
MPKDTSLTDAQVAERLRELPGWSVEAGMLARRYATDGWPTTLMLVNAIGFLAEAADHHPDLAVSWGKMEVRLSTHSAKGITDKDFALAREIDRLALWRPEPGGALAGVRRAWVRAAEAASTGAGSSS